MSGPKCVRFVSVEELLATCQSRLEQYKSLVASWKVRVHRAGVNEEGDEDLLQRVHQRFDAMIAEGDFTEFQKRIESETAWLEQEFERRVNAKVERDRRERQSIRRRVSAAATVLVAAEKQPGRVAAEVLAVLKQAANGSVVDGVAINKAVSVAFDSLARTEEATVSEEQRELAVALGVGQERQNIHDWIEQSSPADEDSGGRLDQMLSEMSLRLGAEAVSPFLDRGAQLAQEGDPYRRKLLIDSLTIEMAEFDRITSAHERLVDDGKSVLAGLRAHSDVFSSVIDRLEVALANSTGQPLQEAITEAKKEQERSIAEQGLEHRRKAVLEAMGSLGYQVEEGMETALAHEGRVVVERRDLPGYGVELAGLVANDKFQVRAMRFDDTEGGEAEDLQHEGEWCKTFSDLRAILGQAGDEIVIESAIGVGQRPLKVVGRETRRRRIERPTTKTRRHRTDG